MMRYLIVLIFMLEICFANAQVIKNGDFEIWDHPKPFVYVSDLKKGIYLLELGTDKGSFSQKLVIN